MDAELQGRFLIALFSYVRTPLVENIHVLFDRHAHLRVLVVIFRTK